MLFWKRKISGEYDITPDEVFLDSENIPGFSTERFEGVIERPVARRSFVFFGTLLFLGGIGIAGRTFWLQVVRGDEFHQRAETNYIETRHIEPPRGIIYDRKGVPIVYNEAYTDEKGKIRYRRKVKHPLAFSHIVGLVGESDNASKASEPYKRVGKSGLEQNYNELLRGIPGEENEELDAAGNVITRGLVSHPKAGENFHSSIDADLQEAFFELINNTINNHGYLGGAGVVYSMKTGEILSLVSAPSFDINAMSAGLAPAAAKEIFESERAPLFNRAISGTYAPGSTIKPFLALAALEEGVIGPEREIVSTGALVVPNPFNPSSPSIFKDWRAHGATDMRRAIAVSSDVYFYTIGGGFGDIKGLGISRIKSWLSKFGFDSKTGIDIAGEKTGFLPDPETKKRDHPDNPIWRVGDTYNASIGQGDTQFTPIGLARAMSAIARQGEFLTLSLEKHSKPDVTVLDAQKNNIRIIAEGMRQTVSGGGTAASLNGLPFTVAAKTGSAEVGFRKERTNAWFIGFAPYEDPQIGVVIFLEAGPRVNTVGGVAVASELFRWINEKGGIELIVK